MAKKEKEEVVFGYESTPDGRILEGLKETTQVLRDILDQLRELNQKIPKRY